MVQMSYLWIDYPAGKARKGGRAYRDNLLTNVEKGASINSNLQKNDPPGLSKLESPDLLETFKHISNVQMKIERGMYEQA